MITVRPFRPTGATRNLPVTTVAVDTYFDGGSVGTRAVRVVNKGDNYIYINIGTSPVTAAVVTGLPMIPNSVETFLLRSTDDRIAFIAEADGNTIFFTVGESA